MTSCVRIDINFTSAGQAALEGLRRSSPRASAAPREVDAQVGQPGGQVVAVRGELVHGPVRGLQGPLGGTTVDQVFAERTEQLVRVEDLRAAAIAQHDVQVQIHELPGALAGPDQADVEIKVLVTLVSGAEV